MSGRWRVSSLDMELRYRPVVESLPTWVDGEVCEVGSGPIGLAAWTERQVVGIDPRVPDGDSGYGRPRNLRYIRGSAEEIPLPDRSVAAAVAIDALEHVPPAARPRVLREMSRVTMDGGRVIINGPLGPAAADGDRRVLHHLRARGFGTGDSARWLEQHLAYGLPTQSEIVRSLSDSRVRSITACGVFNLRLWYVMHLAAMGLIPPTGPLHPLVWGPFALVARRFHRPPCYRQLIVAEIGVPGADRMSVAHGSQDRRTTR